MAKKKVLVKWRTVTREQEKMIIRDFNRRKVRNEILRKYGIPVGQFCRIIRNTGTVLKIN